ncbi:hypothetical protein FHR90_003078 [Endobacter medicaginis]|uniref:CobQ/CobB/MinD/ParA nucleotide binding domain-containing protein n=1 Tax=Endobacter medicaginis TaxID=1181271 RepID=A0A839V442_9PROT|nr:hypothetical protein [Endobacter medicaginis]MBB3175224.1 hypothetical protein [Endobacter medicaginis]MCX5476252.1 hypothetical protein [Endobacter medicaginis]NVN28985.1 hypothetical protein [Endobacter medicaginis]
MATVRTTDKQAAAAQPSAPAPEAGAPSRVAKFDPALHRAKAPALDVSQFTPVALTDGEPVVAQGIDLTGKTKIVFVNGRGKTGKTTFLRWVAERAVLGNRPFMMADLDPTNASFSSYFDDVSRPNRSDPAGVTAWLHELIEHALSEKVSVVCDMGGGDTTLRETAAQMPGFAQEIEAMGAAPVLLSTVGTQPDDLAAISALTSRGFAPKARGILFNEAAIDLGLSRNEAFAEVFENAITIGELQSGAVPLWIPRLHAAAAVENRRAYYSDARDGQTTPPLGLFDRSRVRSWLETMDRRFAGITSWLP